MRARREALSAAERSVRAGAARDRLLGVPELGEVKGRTVAGYVAIKGELDPAPALAAIAAKGAEVALPRLSDDGSELRFHRSPPGHPLVAGRFGLSEPDPQSPAVALSEIDVMLVPGLAFDSEGRRLGFGRGYYDRALSPIPPASRPALVGLAYDFQIISDCPFGDGDVGVDLVVTDARTIRPKVRE